MTSKLEQNKLSQVAQDLINVLSNTYILYVKTQNFHWNLLGPEFYSLHKMFEKQYEELAEAVDEIAERIRMLDHKAPGSMREFLEKGTLDESENTLNSRQMIEQLSRDHAWIIQDLQVKIEDAQKLGDEGTADLLIQRLRSHDKAAWMLRSHLK